MVKFIVKLFSNIFDRANANHLSTAHEDQAKYYVWKPDFIFTHTAVFVSVTLVTMDWQQAQTVLTLKQSLHTMIYVNYYFTRNFDITTLDRGRFFDLYYMKNKRLDASSLLVYRHRTAFRRHRLFLYLSSRRLSYVFVCYRPAWGQGFSQLTKHFFRESLRSRRRSGNSDWRHTRRRVFAGNP